MENIKNTANETANNLAKKTYDVTVVLESSVENEDEYPGMVITIANKFLAMLGFTDNVTFRRK